MPARKLTKGLCLAALGLLLAGLPVAHGGPIPSQIDFSTIGSVDSFNVSGTPVVSFQGATGTITSGTPFSLGSFSISASSGRNNHHVLEYSVPDPVQDRSRQRNSTCPERDPGRPHRAPQWHRERRYRRLDSPIKPDGNLQRPSLHT